MKPIFVPQESVPRLNSLLHRLQKNPGPDEQSRLDQLMIFLDDPPPGVTDRWTQAAEMCAAWNLPTSGTSVWRLYRSYIIEWRARLALDSDDVGAETLETLAEKAARLIALRTCEMLAHPETSHATLVSLARIGLRQKALELARQKHQDAQIDDDKRAMDALALRARRSLEAKFAFDQLKVALDRPLPQDAAMAAAVLNALKSDPYTPYA